MPYIFRDYKLLYYNMLYGTIFILLYEFYVSHNQFDWRNNLKKKKKKRIFASTKKEQGYV